MKVHMDDIRAARICSGGARTFFKDHGWDWGDFLSNGIDEELLLETGDIFAKKAVEVAHGRRR